MTLIRDSTLPVIVEILAAVRRAGSEGLRHENFGARVRYALGFVASRSERRRDWMADPEAVGIRQINAERTIGQILAQKVWVDQRRGWRFTNPNLEALGLIKVIYPGLEELSAQTEFFHDPVIRSATPEVRTGAFTTLFDSLRRGLAVTAEDFAGFTVFWLILHATRFGQPAAPATDCILEQWRESGAKQGLTARNRLSDGVTAALLALGNGLLAHPANVDLREYAAGGGLQPFFQELLRLVYQLIFLLVAEDRNLLHSPEAPEAIFRLAWLREDSSIVRVNWRDMETEELGSVYEGLLELTPRLTSDGHGFAFAEGTEAKGNARKTSGSYYTPNSLVQALLDSTLDPVLDRIEREAEDIPAALLSLTVVDPACGSGHFLLAAARHIAGRLVRARTAGLPTAADNRHALRDVVRSVLYGVDRNPMAVELARVALWIESVDPGKPLGFLDANLKVGDSLLGIFSLDALTQGIPDAAYKPLTGDDKPLPATS